MKKFAIILVLILVLTLSFSAFACDSNKNNNSGGTTNNNNTNNTNEDGFIKGTTTIEELSEDLVKSLFNSAKTAGSTRLNASNPCVSWHIELDAKINAVETSIVFEINYDNRDKSETEMKLSITKKGEQSPSVSLYYFQDRPTESANPGNLYVQYGDAKVKVPVVDTFLGQLFPISFSGVEEQVVAGFLSANIFTKGDIQYKYKDGTDGKRTRNYIFQVDLKATLVNIVNMMQGSSGFEEMYESVSWIIESLFGVEASKINSQLPDTTLVVDVTTTGGSRTLLGNGNISNFKMVADVAASDYKDSIFRGESYNITMEMVEFKASSKLIEDFPEESSEHFSTYINYEDTALIINGSLVYLEDEDTVYDISLGFRYDGLGDSQNNDEVKIVLYERNNPNNKIVEFYSFDNTAYFNFYCAQGGEWVETSFPFDIDHFIEYMMEIGSVGDRLGFLKSIAYALGAIQVWEDGSLSLNIDANLYQGILNLDIDSLIRGIEDACTYAGGTTSTISSQFDAHNTNLETVLSGLVIEKEVLLILSNGDDSIDTTDNLIDRSLFE